MKITDFQNESGTRFTDEQLELVYGKIKDEEFDKDEISDLAQELEESDDFGRTKESAKFALTRMHILIHGIAPDGETERRAETMFTIPNTMNEFAARKGIDTFENIERAREELKHRPVRVKREDAKEMMLDYYHENKDWLPKDIAKDREDIIDSIMNGDDPDEAFSKAEELQ